jgi:hypothetical protein
LLFCFPNATCHQSENPDSSLCFFEMQHAALRRGHPHAHHAHGGKPPLYLQRYAQQAALGGLQYPAGYGSSAGTGVYNLGVHYGGGAVQRECRVYHPNLGFLWFKAPENLWLQAPGFKH